MIYVASPYTHSDPVIMRGRYFQAMQYTGRLLKSGHLAFSPIAYGHQFFAHEFTPGTADYWEEFNSKMLSLSTSMHLLMLPGWEESRGCAAELNYAADHNMPVVHIPWGEQNG